MEYLQIKNLDRYQPHYRDERKVIWIRWDVGAMRDYKITKLSPTQKWLFIGLICLACTHHNQVPFDKEWISEELKYPLKAILNDLKMLQTLELIVTNSHELLQNDTYRQTDIQTDNRYIVEVFNYFLLKTKKAFRLTPTNRKMINKRFEEGYTPEQLKKAIDNFVLDDWEGRNRHLDLIYCLGKQNGKPDALEKWLNYEPKSKATEVKYV